MKSLLITILSFLIVLGSFGQTTNSDENPDIKIEWTAQLPDNTNIITVTNKQSCPADITVMYNWDRVKTIDPFCSDTFHIVLYQSCVLRAKSNPVCTGTVYGTVSINLCSILPIKFTFFDVKKLSETEIQVEFELAETTSINIIGIQVSTNSKDFRNVDLVLGENIKPNTRIVKKVKIQ